MEFYKPVDHTDDEIKDLLAQPGKQVMFLQADWCGDCKAIKPFVKDIKEAVENAGASWFDADRDANLAIAQEQGLMGIPAFVLFEGGEQVAHIGNGERLNPNDVLAWVTKNIA